MIILEVLKSKSFQIGLAFLSGATLVYLISGRLIKNKYSYYIDKPEIKINPNDIMWLDKKVKVSFRLNGKELNKTVGVLDKSTSVIDGKYTVITDSNSDGNGVFLGIKNNDEDKMEDVVILNFNK
jgi:hypothetical protein